MSNTTVKIIAVAVVAIVATAGISYVLLHEGEETNAELGFLLPVYGNANEDAFIDNDDLDIINKIIAGEDGYTLSKYPMADADADGKVDEKDAKLVKDIINKKADTTVYHLNYYNDGGRQVYTKLASSKWPIENVMVTYNSVMFIVAALGVQDKVAGATAVGGGWYEKVLYSTMKDNAIPFSTGDIEEVQNVMEKKGCRTILCSGYSQWDVGNEQDYEDVGCDVVRLCESNPVLNPTLSSILLAGFFLGVEDRAFELTKLGKKMWEDTLDIAKTIPEDKKVSFTVGTGVQTFAPSSNQHAFKCEIVGGINAAQKYDPPMNEGGSYSFGDWIYNCEIDKMLNVIWSNDGNGFFFGKTLNKDKLLEDVKLWENTQAYLKGEVYFVYGDFFTPMEPLIRGYTLYPEYYGDLYEECLDELLGMLGEEYRNAGLKFVFSLEEMRNYPVTPK